MLLRDDDLLPEGEKWPARYGLHARVLNAILANHPKALFIDIVFEDKREDQTLAQLITAFHRYEARNIPVYAAESTRRTGTAYARSSPSWDSFTRCRSQRESIRWTASRASTTWLFTPR